MSKPHRHRDNRQSRQVEWSQQVVEEKGARRLSSAQDSRGWSLWYNKGGHCRLGKKGPKGPLPVKGMFSGDDVGRVFGVGSEEAGEWQIDKRVDAQLAGLLLKGRKGSLAVYRRAIACRGGEQSWRCWAALDVAAAKESHVLC